MIDRIYLEHDVAEHPRTRQILARFPRAVTVPCERYGEVFNRKAQSFRLQKKRPALILARKHGQLVLPAPYSVGGENNHYFSHMLNCVFDCRYCFLQGMYRSAHYVLFVNYEEFFTQFDEEMSDGQPHWFFSGYDCDSLALDGVTGFVDAFLPYFERTPNAWLELRTKSVQVRSLLSRKPIPNCVVAFSFTSEPTLEDKVPPLEQRLDAMRTLAEAGWFVGLRFDPLIYHPDYCQRYEELFDRVLGAIPDERLHSVSLGAFRLPRAYHRTIERMYPEEPLLSGPLVDHDGMVSYTTQISEAMISFCNEQLRSRVPDERYFPCLI